MAYFFQASVLFSTIDKYKVYMILWKDDLSRANDFGYLQSLFFCGTNPQFQNRLLILSGKARQMILRGGEDLAREGASRAESGAVVGGGSPSLAPETRP